MVPNSMTSSCNVWLHMRLAGSQDICNHRLHNGSSGRPRRVASVLEGISIVATDLDGTLLTSEGHISDRTRTALERAAEAGITVIVVTARPYWALRDLKLRDVHALVICVNGALIVDLDTDAVV